MVDYVTLIIQGVLLGVGFGIGLWVYNSYIKPKLDKFKQ